MVTRRDRPRRVLTSAVVPVALPRTERARAAHVEIASAAHPLLRLLDAQRRHQPQTGLRVREDPHHPRAPLDLLVESLQAIRGAYPGPMRQGEGQTGRQSSIPSSSSRATAGWDRLPPCRHRFCRRHRLFPRRRREDFSKIRRQFSASSRPHHADQIASEMDLAPLPARALEMPVNRRFQSRMAVARHQPHAAQAARFEIAKR